MPGRLLIPTGTSLWDVWRRHGDTKPDVEAIVHWSALEPAVRWSWSALLDRAEFFARALSASGVRAGQVCALVIRHHRDFYPLYMAIEALGAIPAVLAYPNPRLHPDKFRDGISGMARRSGLDWILTERDLEPIVRPLVEQPTSKLQGLLFPLEAASAAALELPRVSPAPGDPCLLQHSSGTTGLQKAVMLSHHSVLTHLAHYADAIALSASDRIVSWLPLYHDMGLIAAFHMPLAFGITAVHIDPFEWINFPASFLIAASAERGTISWMPNFAYNVLAERAHDDDLEEVRLDSMRLLINCSEPVRAESHERFVARFASFGFRPQAIAACYAMAETTFAVCQSVPDTEPIVVHASRARLAEGRYVAADTPDDVRRCVSSGNPIPSTSIRIVTEAGEALDDGLVGEIVVHSDSLFDGYRNNPEQTTRVLRDGWYRTGDLGFRLEREHFIIGRKKDVIIVAGNNILPEDVEDAVSAVPGILPGRVVACGVDDAALGTERIWVIAETSTPTADHRALELAVVRAGMAIDVSIARVVLVEPRWLIKSSAGKPSRHANAARLAELVQTGVTRA